MSKRQQLAREKLEIYLVHLLLAYRRLIFIIGVLLLIYAVTFLFINTLIGIASLLPALYLLLLSNSYPIVLYTARLGSWMGTMWRHED